MLHCWRHHLQQLLPPPPALDHHPGLGGHRGAQVLPHSGLEDQQGQAGLREAHQLPPGLQLVPEDKVKVRNAIVIRKNKHTDVINNSIRF